MPTYPIESDKLLDVADTLAPAQAGRGRPPYAAHRRAVSTAYYAAFHAIGARVAAQSFPSPHIRTLLAPLGGPSLIDNATATIADGFLELNDKREQADYDHEAVFPRADTRGLIALARLVVALVDTSQTIEVSNFFGLIAMQAQIKAR